MRKFKISKYAVVSLTKTVEAKNKKEAIKLFDKDIANLDAYLKYVLTLNELAPEVEEIKIVNTEKE